MRKLFFVLLALSPFVSIATSASTYAASVTISKISAVDTSQNSTINLNDSRPSGDQVSLSISAKGNGVTTVFWNIVETDMNNTSLSQTTTNTGFTDSFTLAPLTINNLTGQPGDTYSYKVTAFATDSNGNRSSNQTFVFYTATQVNASCKTPATGALLTTDIVNKDLILFDNNPPDPNDSNATCKTGYFTNTTNKQNVITTVPGPYYNPTYNNIPKDSVIYYPGTDNAAFVSTVHGRDIWLVTWNWKASNINNEVDPQSVRATQIVFNIPPGAQWAIDMDTGAGYLFISCGPNYILRIPFSSISNALNGWLINPGSIVSPVNAVNDTFLNQGFMQNINGIVLVNAKSGPLLYLSYVSNINGHKIFAAYPANKGLNPKPVYVLDTGFGPQGYTFNNHALALQSNWGMDGMTVSYDNKYIYSVTDYGKLIFVLQNVDNSAPGNKGASILGLTYAPNIPDPTPAKNGMATGLDGAEIDQFGQLYIAGYLTGIYSTNASDVIKAAIGNNRNSTTYIGTQAIYQGYTIPFIQYYGVPNGESWDDIAPFKSIGAAPSPYYLTTQGNVYSEGGYAISKVMGNPFSTYSLISDATNTILNGTGSFYHWEFQHYASNLNHSGGLKAIYTAKSLYSQICGTQKCQSYSGTSLSSTPNNMSGGVYTYNCNSSCTFTIDASNGGLYGDGVLIVLGGGNINITIDNMDDFAKSSNRILLITDGNVDIHPANPPYNIQSNQILKQYLYMMVVADGNITVDNYVIAPNVTQPMVIKGMLISYGKVSLNFNAGSLNQFDPAVEIDYDASYLTKFSHFFEAPVFSQEVGL